MVAPASPAAPVLCLREGGADALPSVRWGSPVLCALLQSDSAMTAAARTEHAEAVNLMRVVKLHEARYPALKLLFAVPNGGDRHKIVAAKMKAEGVKPGVPDYLLPVRSPEYIGLAIELKSMTGYASKEQKQWIEDLRAAGWRAEVCRGWGEAWRVIREYVGVLA